MRVEVLDHGYVELVETWGHGKCGNLDASPDMEAAIIEAARQSTQGSFRGWAADENLLAYLFNNQHSTPFEFCGMTIEVQAPIFVFREWHRHRTQSYNEMSARYSPLPDLYYRPSFTNVMERGQAASGNKQATGVEEFSSSYASVWTGYVKEFYESAERLYQGALKAGIPKELARIVMPVGHYSRMRASANLRNWLAFMTLRCDTRAQWEIQQYAGAVASIVQGHFPRTFELWKKQNLR